MVRICTKMVTVLANRFVQGLEGESRVNYRRKVLTVIDRFALVERRERYDSLDMEPRVTIIAQNVSEL
jgi:hypothetical protein